MNPDLGGNLVEKKVNEEGWWWKKRKKEEARNRFSISAEDENMHILIHIPIKTRRATSMGRCKALPLPV